MQKRNLVIAKKKTTEETKKTNKKTKNKKTKNKRTPAHRERNTRLVSICRCKKMMVVLRDGQIVINKSINTSYNQQQQGTSSQYYRIWGRRMQKSTLAPTADGRIPITMQITHLFTSSRRHDVGPCPARPSSRLDDRAHSISIHEAGIYIQASIYLILFIRKVPPYPHRQIWI